MPAYVALLYSIVLSPERRIVMADLRAAAEALGFVAPRTVASTGNLVFETASDDPHRLEGQLEAEIASRFGKAIDVIVRDAAAWRRLVASNPFPAESVVDGSRVVVRVMRQPIDGSEFAAIESRAGAGEQVALAGGDLWVAFGERPSLSPLLGAINARRLGVGTARNWNTVRRLGVMVETA